MSAPHPVYRFLVRLYPKTFRRQYGDDLVQHFSDLVADRGARAAWSRTGLDLIITAPRYRLESIMNEQHSATTLNVTIAALAAGGVVSVLTGVYPGIVLVVAALVLAIVQRSSLARAIRTPDSNRRRLRLRIAAVFCVIFVASFMAYLLLIGDTWTIRETALAVIGNSAMIGAIAFLIAGLLTPKTPDQRPLTPAR